MKLKILVLISLTFFVFSFSQNTIGTTLITNSSAEGLTLFTSSTQTYLINNCGEVVREWSSAYPPGNAVYLREDGSILRAGRTDSTDIIFGGQGGVVEIFDWDGNLIWQYFYDTPSMRQHHDVYPMPNGNVLILAATVLTNNQAVEAGRDPTKLSQGSLYNERIVEVIPNGLNEGIEVWQWNISDHLIQNFDSSKDNFGDVTLNEGKLDINFLNGGADNSNWIHMNSIQYNEDLDQIVLSSRKLSEIYIIDHSTTTLEAASASGGIYGKGGDFLYRWGNPQSYGQGDESDRKLYGQHYAHFISSGLKDEGKLIIYNNGNGRNPSFSEVMILDPIDTNLGFYNYTPNTAYGPNNTDFTYKDPIDPTNFFSNILSSAQRLQNGNLLICEGINGRFFEIDEDENMVWEYINPVNNITGAIASQGDDPEQLTNPTFRLLKYNLDYPAFNGRDISGNSPIENNSSTNVSCSTLRMEDFELKNITLYPIPTTSILNIRTEANINWVEIYALDGSIIKRINKRKSFDISDLADGIYVVKITSDYNITFKKIIKG